MTLPVPEVRARPSVVGRGVPPRVPRGEDPSACRRRLFPPSRLSPAFASTRAARFFRGVPVPSASASRPGGRPPSVSLPPSPLARCVVSRPAGSRSPDPARSGSGIIPLSPALSLAAACVGGPAAAPHPLSSARPRPPAWNRGVVSRRGASRGSASVSRRRGGSRRVASPGPGHPSPSSRSLLSRSSLRVPPCAARSPRRCVGGSPGVPVVPSGGRRPRAVLSRLSFPARVWVFFRPPRAPLARSRVSRPRSTPGGPAGPSGRFGSPCFSARAPTWLILPVAYACLKD